MDLKDCLDDLIEFAEKARSSGKKRASPKPHTRHTRTKTVAVRPHGPTKQERPKYSDGRTIPQEGDRVHHVWGGFGGSDAGANGVVVRNRKGELRVKVERIGGLFGAGELPKRAIPLTPQWTVNGEKHPALAARESYQAKVKQEQDEWQAEQERLKAEIEMSHQAGWLHADQIVPQVGMRVQHVNTGQTGIITETGYSDTRQEWQPYVRWDDEPKTNSGGFAPGKWLLLLPKRKVKKE